MTTTANLKGAIAYPMWKNANLQIGRAAALTCVNGRRADADRGAPGRQRLGCA
jgi:hypothetical protein